MKQYIVDAFTSEPFSGNPAAVCVMEGWPSDEAMMKLVLENNLSETAFIVKAVVTCIVSFPGMEGSLSAVKRFS